MAKGLHHLISGKTDLFTHVYDCTTPGHDDHWFLMIAARLKGSPDFAILHVSLGEFLFSKLGPLAASLEFGSAARQLEELVVRGINRAVSEALAPGVSTRPHSPEKHTVQLLATLTPGQVEVLKLLATGASNAEISRKRQVSIQAAKAQVTALIKKLNLENRTQTAIFAVRHGLAG